MLFGLLADKSQKSLSKFLSKSKSNTIGSGSLLFKYRAMDSKGAEIQGQCWANDQSQAIGDIRSQGCFPTRVTEVESTDELEADKQSRASDIAEVIKAYVWIRKNNSTIPDNILDLMKDSAIRELERS